MAHSNLASTLSTDFPQPYSGTMLDSLVAGVDRVLAAQEALPGCEFDSHQGAFACGRPAVVTDLETEQSLCLRCFRG